MMHSQKEVLKLAEFYADKVINKPLDLRKAKSFLISRFKIEEAKGGGYILYCYARSSASVELYRDIKLVARDLGLQSPEEVLNMALRNELEP